MIDFSLLHFYDWRDVLELSFLIILLYCWLLFLNKDRYFHLIGYFYGYCAIALVSYWLNLQLMWTLFIGTFPVVMTLFIIMHQRTLQKQVLLGTALPLKNKSSNWVHEVIAAGITAHHKKQSLICLIERQFPLQSFFDVSFLMNAEITKELITLLLEVSHKPSSLFWLDEAGILKAYDAEIAAEFSEEQSFLAPEKMLEKLMVLTDKTDMLVLINCPATHKFIILAQGIAYENLTPQECFGLLKKLLYLGSDHVQEIFSSSVAYQSRSRENFSAH